MTSLACSTTSLNNELCFILFCGLIVVILQLFFVLTFSHFELMQNYHLSLDMTAVMSCVTWRVTASFFRLHRQGPDPLVWQTTLEMVCGDGAEGVGTGDDRSCAAAVVTV